MSTRYLFIDFVRWHETFRLLWTATGNDPEMEHVRHVAHTSTIDHHHPWPDGLAEKIWLTKFPLSSAAEASLCCREAGEKEKDSARGTMGRGREKRGPFPLPIVPRALSIFRLLLLLLGYPAGASAEERAKFPIITREYLTFYQSVPVLAPWVSKYLFTDNREWHRLSQSPSPLVSGSGSRPQRPALSLALPHRNQKNRSIYTRKIKTRLK